MVSKAAYVKAQGQTRSHHCHWPGCDKQVPPAMWGCKAHWFKLPAELRARVWSTYRPGQEADMSPSRAYLDAADEVQRWIRTLERPAAPVAMEQTEAATVGQPLAMLPAKPEGWTKHLIQHLNFGREGGSGLYTIKNADGESMPIGYQYDTRKGGLTGFTLPGVDGVMTWAQLVDAWPAYLERTKAEASHG